MGPVECAYCSEIGTKVKRDRISLSLWVARHCAPRHPAQAGILSQNGQRVRSPFEPAARVADIKNELIVKISSFLISRQRDTVRTFLQLGLEEGEWMQVKRLVINRDDSSGGRVGYALILADQMDVR